VAPSILGWLNCARKYTAISLQRNGDDFLGKGNLRRLVLGWSEGLGLAVLILKLPIYLWLAILEWSLQINGEINIQFDVQVFWFSSQPRRDFRR